MPRWVTLLVASLSVSSCVSTGNLGLVTKSGTNPGALLSEPHAYTDLGPARGNACRFFLIAVVPWGDSTLSAAVEQALAKSGGDALLNVTTSSSLYGFVPIYNVLSFTCTDVKGTAIRLEPASAPPPAHAATP